MQKQLLSVAVATVFASGCSTVTKAPPPITESVTANSGHLASSDGLITKTGTGDCMRTGSWSKNDMLDICERIEKIEQVAELEIKEPEPVVATAAPVPETKAPVKTEVIETVLLNSRALFGTDADSLSDKGDKAISNLIAKLSAYDSIDKIEIIGHTDNTGTESYNMQLSERRVATILGLVQKSYNDTDITTVAMGESKPTASNNTAEGRQQNRRVEIRVTAKYKKVA